MAWESPYLLLLAVPALVLLFWADSRSQHPMGEGRRRLLFFCRALGVVIALAALASPALVTLSRSQAVVLILDESQSQGQGGVERVYAAAERVRSTLGSGVSVHQVAAGKMARVLDELVLPGEAERDDLLKENGARTDFSAAIDLAEGLFPAGAARHVVLIGDGRETAGDLLGTATRAAVSGLHIHTVPVAGDIRPDVSVVQLTPNNTRLSEGASVELKATVESSLAGSGQLRLFENGLQVDTRPLTVGPGETCEVRFTRNPGKRNTYNYRLVAEGFAADSLAANNEAIAIVDVRGQPLFLYVEGEMDEAPHLVAAMEKEGIRLEFRQPRDFPPSLNELIAYDGVILSDVSSLELPTSALVSIREYVDQLGGGLVMIGGRQSFALGGYYRSPLEDALPVHLKPPDEEEIQSCALALVIDRSGSMAGEKIEICKSAAIATAEMLTRKDFIGVYAFDSQVSEVLPMTRITSLSSIAARISTLTPGGGTNVRPGMESARAALGKVKARKKHMIVLTDGNTAGEGYDELARQCRNERITISTVTVGENAAFALLQSIADAGGGQAYRTTDPSAITRIFTQDAMVHAGRLLREDPFSPRQQEKHPMLREWDRSPPPPLLGYVKTYPRSTAQLPLVTEQGDPLLAHWRYGLGKVTAFTSDCKSRWGALWVQRWEGYAQFWAQVLRETARPPQGRNIDLRVQRDGDARIIEVDLLEDAASFRQNARVGAELFFLPLQSLAGSMRLLDATVLEQVGPGRYRTRFRPDEAGVYLVRVNHGSEVLSTGIVNRPSTEAADGRVDDDLLKKVSALTGGTYVTDPEARLDFGSFTVNRYRELRPYLLIALLGVFMLDLVVRRWENVRGLLASRG